jgi:hypothetical protein
MGGVVPLGYRVQDRALHIVEEHAVLVRDLFRRYLEMGTVVELQATLDKENVRLPVRTDGTGKTTGGGLISRGHLYKILSNPIYVGRLSHKTQVHDGQHEAIIDQIIWDRVQSELAAHAHRRKAARQDSEALLAGKLFDDRGNAMSPSHATKGGKRWRYYVSQALLQGRKSDAGSAARVPAPDVEKRIIEAIGGRVDSNQNDPDRAANLRAAIERVTISRTTITIQLSDAIVGESRDRTLTVDWTAPSSTRRREILLGEGSQTATVRPMREKARAGVVDGLRDAYRWIDELTADPRQSVEAIAIREGKTERSIRMTISLAFLAPAIVKAAIEGRLPRGFGVTRLADAPMAWSAQWAAFGLAPAAAI